MTTNYVLQILIWSIIIIVICSIGLAIYNGYSFAEFPKAILFAILYILQPLKIILRPLKNLLYYIYLEFGNLLHLLLIKQMVV